MTLRNCFCEIAWPVRVLAGNCVDRWLHTYVLYCMNLCMVWNTISRNICRFLWGISFRLERSFWVEYFLWSKVFRPLMSMIPKQPMEPSLLYPGYVDNIWWVDAVMCIFSTYLGNWLLNDEVCVCLSVEAGTLLYLHPHC